MPIRSWLFVPADSARKLEKAAALPADVVVLDLEDAVAPAARPLARQQAAAWLAAHRGGPQGRWVRINPLDRSGWRDDLAAILPAAPDGLVVPKLLAPAQLVDLDQALSEAERHLGLPQGAIRLLPQLAETPAAALALPAWATPEAGSARLIGFGWGIEDLAAALGSARKRDEHGALIDPLRLVRAQVLLVAAARGLAAIDTAFADLRDAAGLERTARTAAADGFAGMLAIHPDQVEPINAAFTPTPQAIAEARAIVEAFAARPGAGVLALNGRMIEPPHLAQARRLLARLG